VLFDPSSETLAMLIAAFLHECGHLAVIFITGIGASEVRITPYGLEISTKRRYRSFGEELAVSVAGCAVNFLTFLAFWRATGLIEGIAYASLVFGILNILPILSLDGGEALRAFFSIIFPFKKAERYAKIISFFTLTVLWCIAAYIFLFSGYNYSLFIMAVWLFGKIYCT
jgi:stage IV sporulation protein FB